MLKPFDMQEVEELFKKSSFDKYLKKVSPTNVFTEENSNKNEDEDEDEDLMSDDEIENEKETTKEKSEEIEEDIEEEDEDIEEEEENDEENVREVIINFISLTNKDFKLLKETDSDLFEELYNTCKYIYKLQE